MYKILKHFVQMLSPIMYKMLSPKIIAEIEKRLLSSLLDEDTVNIIQGLIVGQVFLRDLFEQLVRETGHQRTKIIREIAKILEIDIKKKDSNPPTPDPSSETTSTNSDPLSENTSTNQPGDLPNSPFDEEGQPENPEINPEESGNKDSKGKKGENPPPKKKRKKRSNDDYLPINSHIHFHETLEPGDPCPECPKGRVYLFREKVIPILIGRSPLAYEEHRLQILRCNACGAIFEPKLPEEIPKTGHSLPSAQAALTLLHYNIGTPFTSISDFQEMFYQNVSTSQLWDVIEQAVQAVEPVYYELENRAADSELFYTDDTTARILAHYSINKENREKKKRKKAPKDRVGTYSSVIIGCNKNGSEIHLFYHGRKYAGENLSDLLVNRDNPLDVPIQMKDASTMNVPIETEVIEAKCNAHAIRKFKDIKDLYPNWCDEVLRRYAKVSDNERNLRLKGVNNSARLTYHKAHSLPLMEEIKNYLNELIENKEVEPNSSLGKAIDYFCIHYPELTAFCHIEGAPFDNNKAERSLKKIIRLRKTSMFYKTERGAEIAGKLHSVIHTAQAAGVNALDYLQTLMENPEKVRKSPSDFLPWTFQKTIEEYKTAGSTENVQEVEESLETLLDSFV